jgi:predicted DNA-binding protein
MRNERVRLQPYVDAPLAQQLAAYSAATGKTTSFVVQAALRQYLDRTDDKVLVLQQIAGLRRGWNQTHRDLAIHMEAFAIYVKLWFAHTPQIPDSAVDYARRTAESRFAQFQDYVVEQFQGGRRFVDDLPREAIADEAELSRMASEGPTDPAGGETLSGTNEE